jgi:serine/threonine protein kinase
LIKQIGRGSFSSVWLAEAPGQILAALRIIPLPTDEADRQELLQALEPLPQLRHPSLIHLHGYWSDQDHLYLAMEAAETDLGRQLRERLSKGQGALSADEAVSLIREVAGALDYLHDAKVLHRDVKPSNILLCGGQPRLGEVWLPFRFGSVASANFAGVSPAYTAPEMFKGKTSKAADQYSLAITYAELRLGRLPFDGSVAELMIAHMQQTPLLDPLPEPEQRVLRRALAKDPDQRYPSCKALAEALEKARRGEDHHQEIVGSLSAPVPAGAVAATIPESGLSTATSPPTLKRTYLRKTESPPTRDFRPQSVSPGWMVLALAITLVVLALAFLYWLWEPLLSWLRSVDSREGGWVTGGAGLALALLLIGWWGRQRTVQPLPIEEKAHPAPPPPVEPKNIPKRSGASTIDFIPARPVLPAVELCYLEGHRDAVWSVAYFPGGRFALSGSMDATFRLWNLHTRREVRQLTGHTEGVTSVAFSPVGRQAVTGSLDETVRLWECATGIEERVFRGHAGRVFAVAFTPDGESIVSGGEDRTLRLWDADSGKELRRFEGHTGWVTSLAVSPDGKYLISGSDDHTVRVWDLRRGELVRCLEGHRGPIKSVAISPENDHVVSGSQDCTFRIWSLATGSELRCVQGHTDWVRGVAFSPDGLRILSGSDDETMGLWDAATGELIHRFEGHLGSVLSVAFEPNEQRAVTGSDDNSVRLWQLPG